MSDETNGRPLALDRAEVIVRAVGRDGVPFEAVFEVTDLQMHVEYPVERRLHVRSKMPEFAPMFPGSFSLSGTLEAKAPP